MIQHQKWLGMDNYLITESDKGSVQCKIYSEPYSDFNIKAYIERLWVEPEHRRKHIATQLLIQAENIARDCGCDYVYLEWHPQEAEEYALQFYERHGYQELCFNNEGCTLLRKTL